MGYIYKITNKINSKVYIGKTTIKPEVRWKQHKQYFNKKISYVKPLYLSMQKYGIDNFKFEVIGEYSNNLLNKKEVEAIKEHKSFGKGGYNATNGGDGSKKLDDTKIINLYNKLQNISEVHKALSISRITVRNILRSNNIQIGNLNSYLKFQTKISQFDLNDNLIQDYNSMKDAVNSLNLNKKASSHISKCCSGKRLTAYGFKWKYKE